jgi:hypothetical protein
VAHACIFPAPCLSLTCELSHYGVTRWLLHPGVPYLFVEKSTKNMAPQCRVLYEDDVFVAEYKIARLNLAPSIEVIYDRVYRAFWAAIGEYQCFIESGTLPVYLWTSETSLTYRRLTEH